MTAMHFPGIPSSVFRVRAGGRIAIFLCLRLDAGGEGASSIPMAMAPAFTSGGSPSA
jgi:hypothetical protein